MHNKSQVNKILIEVRPDGVTWINYRYVYLIEFCHRGMTLPWEKLSAQGPGPNLI